MSEVLKTIEKKILPALMVAVIECQGGKAFAGEVTIPHPQVEGQEKQSVYEEFGEGYRLFEQAIDETTDDELKAAGILNEADKPATIRKALKNVLPLLWSGYSTAVWEQLESTYAVAHYDILTNGARLFFKIERQDEMKRFDQHDYERLVDNIMYRIWDLTGIPVERASSEDEANCVVTLFPTTANHAMALGTSPKNSFESRQAKIFLTVHSVREASGYEEEASDIEKFVREYDLTEIAVHEFCHVISLGHSKKSGDIMDSDQEVTQLKLVDDLKKVPSRDLIYVKRLKQYYAVVSSKNAENSPSLKLVRWLRWQAMKGTLKGLLERAEELAVKRPANKKKSQ